MGNTSNKSLVILLALSLLAAPVHSAWAAVSHGSVSNGDSAPHCTAAGGRDPATDSHGTHASDNHASPDKCADNCCGELCTGAQGLVTAELNFHVSTTAAFEPVRSQQRLPDPPAAARYRPPIVNA